MGELRQYRIQLLALALVFGLSFVPYIAFAGFVEEKVFGLVVGVTGLMVGLGGGILDAGINLFVIRFGDFFLNSGMGVAVNNTWVIIRDFMNLMFIFGLVYIGFKMILGTDTSNSRRWLVNLILAALLINFSLFITKFVIDFSNQMTTEIALAAFNTEDSKNGDGSPTKKVTMSKDLQVRMGITSLLNTGDKNKGILKGDNAWGYIFGTGIFFLITAFVYAAGGILLMIRFAVLNLYMVMSPLLFISWILPPLSGVAAKHWKAFFSKCFFAPVYLLFVYFSLQILDGFQTALPGLGGGEMTNIVSAGSGGATAAAAQSTLPFFILICIFMIASLVVAQKMGAEGASQALSLGKNLSNRAQRFTKQQTLGRGAQAIGGASKLAERGYNRLDANLNRTQGGRILRGALAVGSLGALSDSAIRGGIKAGKGASVAGSETYEQKQKRIDERQKGRNAEVDVSDRSRSVDAAKAILNDPNSTLEQRRDARNATKRSVQGMSTEELLRRNSVVPGQLGDLNNPEFVGHLTDAQLTALKNSGKFRNDQLEGAGSIVDARDQGSLSEMSRILDDTTNSTKDLGNALNELAKTIKGMTNERIADMGIDRLSEPRVAANLTDAQVNDLENRGFTQAQVESVKDSRKNALNEISAGTFVLPMPSNPNMTQTESDAFLADRQQFQKDRKRRLVQNSEQFSQLPASAFGKPGMFEFITPQMLDERLRTNNNFKDAERDTMVTEIQSLINDPSTPTGVVKSWQTQSDRSVNIGRLNLDFSRLQNNQTQTTPAPANTPPTPPPNPAARPPLLTPNSPGWSQANQNLPPRPGPQP